MGVLIADGDPIAYWQTTDRDEFDGGPFVIRRPHSPPRVDPPVIVTLALPPPDDFAKPLD